MYFGGGESPGSVRNQVGRSLNAIRECIDRGDIHALTDHVDFLVTVSAPYIDDFTRYELHVPVMSEDMDETEMEAIEKEIFHKAQAILRKLLQLLAKNGLYAYLQVSEEDASELAL